MKKQIKVIQDQAKTRLDQTKAETDAKVKALQDQAMAAHGMAKARIEKRIAAANADFEVRSRKLSSLGADQGSAGRLGGVRRLIWAQ